jgi:uncharacterized ferritin-like protein (DUF455 family)
MASSDSPNSHCASKQHPAAPSVGTQIQHKRQQPQQQPDRHQQQKQQQQQHHPQQQQQHQQWPGPPDRPARPAKPQLVVPKQVPSPKDSQLPLSAHLLHNLAHIELNAVDLAMDTVARFSRLKLPDGECMWALEGGIL